MLTIESMTIEEYKRNHSIIFENLVEGITGPYHNANFRV